jgi:hypothetical protein
MPKSTDATTEALPKLRLVFVAQIVRRISLAPLGKGMSRSPAFIRSPLQKFCPNFILGVLSIYLFVIFPHFYVLKSEVNFVIHI